MAEKKTKNELKKEKFHKKFKREYGWRITVIALFALLIISMFSGGFKDFFGTSTMSSKKAVDQAVEYINTNILQGETPASLKEVIDSEVDSLYKFNIEIEGRTFPSYVTKDGRYLIPQDLVDMEKKIELPQQTQQQQTPGEYSAEDSAKIESFVNCLAEKGLKIYGANWCGWTEKLVTTFGGFDKVESLYVECTEQQETCSEEGVTGYPTIKINGEVYQEGRTFEEFAKATGCEAPDITASTTGSDTTESGGC